MAYAEGDVRVDEVEMSHDGSEENGGEEEDGVDEGHHWVSVSRKWHGIVLEPLDVFYFL